MSSRRRGNTISSVVEGVNLVREAVFDYFSTHFMAPEVVRPNVEGLMFRYIEYGDGVNLVCPFTIDEVKAPVWDCVGYLYVGFTFA
jgi:hypothetical protein